MIQFNEDEVCQLLRATQYYRDMATGSDEIWDRYNDLMVKLLSYGEDASPNKVNCEMNDLNNLDLGNLYKDCGTKPNIEVYNQYGYSYMPPESWSVPQERPPVCYGSSIPNPEAINTDGVPVDALEWKQILPNFTYTIMNK